MESSLLTRSIAHGFSLKWNIQIEIEWSFKLVAFNAEQIDKLIHTIH